MSSESHALFVETLFGNYCYAAACALLVYDYLLTFGEEVAYIWTSKATGSVVLFFINRAIMLGFAVTSTLIVPWWSNRSAYVWNQFAFLMCQICSFSCRVVNILAQLIVSVASLAIWAVFSAFRVYAVCDRRWTMAIITFIVGIIPVATNLKFLSAYTFNMTSYTLEESNTISHAYKLLNACLSGIKLSESIQVKIVIATRTCLICSDTLVLLTSWYNIHDHIGNPGSWEEKTSLAQVLLRDGTLFFVLLLSLNILDIILYCRQITADFSALINAITTIIISRLMLNFRQVHFAAHGPSGSQSISDVKTESTQPSQLQLSSMEFGSGSEISTSRLQSRSILSSVARISRSELGNFLHQEDSGPAGQVSPQDGEIKRGADEVC